VKGTLCKRANGKGVSIRPKSIGEKVQIRQRWHVEAVFSSLKRMVGELFTSILNIGIINEILRYMLTTSSTLTEMAQHVVKNKK